MANQTKAQLTAQIDFERRERNAAFVNPAQTTLLMNRALDRLLREPGIRTVPNSFFITAVNGIVDFPMPDDFKELLQVISGPGSGNSLTFDYLPIDEFNQLVYGFAYTFERKQGYISLRFGDVSAMPSTSIQLFYWSKNIILDADGTTRKRAWVNDGDTSLLPEEYDEFYISWPVYRIMKREGKKADADDAKAEAVEVLEMLKESPVTKTRRPMRAFGNGLNMGMFGR